MKEEALLRIIKEAEYIVKTGDTVRGAAEVFGVGKSTVHKDVTKRLKKIDSALYKEVKAVLKVNLSERHIRGGNATRLKYLLSKKNPAGRTK
ncbi:MAG TPA: stage III sporulation protein D [Clostridiales bacterium]|mgnify:FL=1|nr:stage III sporulation protein D [Clostridiales bacterium]